MFSKKLLDYVKSADEGGRVVGEYIINDFKTAESLLRRNAE
jgi:hypothetical protein